MMYLLDGTKGGKYEANHKRNDVDVFFTQFCFGGL